MTTVLAGPEAFANGRFPAANQLVVDPDDPAHVVVRATYGTMISHDGGRTLKLVCEQAIGAVGDADPMLGLFAGGTMVAGVVSGLAVTRDDGCSWDLMPGFAPRELVVDVTVQRGDPRRGLVVSSTESGGGFNTVVFETNDGAASFHRVGPALGADFLAQTIEVAPSDPRRIYVSGTVSAEAGIVQTPTIARSSDGGATFERTMLSSYGAGHSAWISAVDPKASGKLYVRLRSTAKDRLLVSSDGAKTFREVYAGAGSLTGFALSPDGSEVAVGGAGDGIVLARTTDFAFRPVSTVHAQCLTWTPAGLYACGVEWLDHFVVGLSVDHGATFAPLSHMSEPCAIQCGASTTVTRMCTPELWRATQAAIQQPAQACGGPAAAVAVDAGAATARTARRLDGQRTQWRWAAWGAGLLAIGGAALIAIRKRSQRRK